jgi:hypothetical protein
MKLNLESTYVKGCNLKKSIEKRTQKTIRIN